MICPKCGSENISVSQTLRDNKTIVKNKHGCLWFILFGWIYLPFKFMVILFKTMYFFIIGIWAKIIKKVIKNNSKMTCICQSYGYHWTQK